MFGWTGRKRTEVAQLTLEAREDLIFKYVAAMETEESATWCKCAWRVHPDDQLIKPGHCRECMLAYKAGKHTGLPEDFESGEAHHFRGIRRARFDDNPKCPVHTREGFLLYFFEWVEKHAGD